ncbi:SgcJ/EcaC family oxidoreductase [Thalassobacillus sp. CUG 92003]|uniref:SgcJ/EcaC family oxidoreductase n=1 Tax=Thalassobacillus sp. CUG 92003 TaxID=2736641 RepID=UPI0015E7C79B|nr:SgcJ/EcaC family oxidoreductase [Thalassobacillus sp. CUG 92003]
MSRNTDEVIQSLYHQLIKAWNERDAAGMASHFSDEGVQIGFDGSTLTGKNEIHSHLEAIFSNNATPPFLTKITKVRKLGDDAAILHAIAGMVPPGSSDINPELNAHQTLVAVLRNNNWEIELFQNTPAQYHGRPELVEQMTEDLKRAQK